MWNTTWTLPKKISINRYEILKHIGNPAGIYRCRLSIEIGYDERLSLSSTTGRSPPSGNSIRANEPHKSVRACLYIYTCIYTHNINIYIYIRVHITCYFGIKRGPWQTEGRRGRRFRFDETRRDNYLESGGTAGTGGEKDATHSVAEAGQAWTDDGVETRLDAGYHHRRSTRLEPTRVDAAAAAAATAAMPLSLSPRGCTGGAVAITEGTMRTERKNDWWLDAVAILVKIRPEGKKGYWLYRPRWNISRNIGWIILRGIRKACGYEYAYIRMESGVLGRKRWGKLGHGVSSQPPHRTPGCQGSEATAPRSRTHLLLILRCCAHDLMDYEWIFHCSSPKRGDPFVAWWRGGNFTDVDSLRLCFRPISAYAMR